MVAVDTQQRETMSVFVPKSTYESHVQAQIDAGRLHPIINDDRAYIDGSGTYDLASGWRDWSTDTTILFDVTDPPAPVGRKCLGATFNAAGAQLRLHTSYDVDEDPRIPSDYTHLAFWIHGGTTGGQQLTASLYDADGVPGNAIAVAPPLAEEWTLVEIPIDQFGVPTIGDIVFDNTAGAAQPTFYMDDIGLLWTDPLPPGVGEYISTNGGAASAQIDCDAEGRVWFSEAETDDILWTTDGVTFNTFLTSNEIVAAYQAHGALDPTVYDGVTNGVQVLGLIRDKMGTAYWGENQTRSIWKAPACGGTEHIIHLATAEEIKDALGIGNSPRGLNCFSIRGLELLTFNFVDSNTVYKVDLETFDYGDFDEDIDVDADDFDVFFLDCMAGPGVSLPPIGCAEEQFDWADLDDDNDVDVADFGKFQLFFTGSL
jgi:hypothetical protein